MARMQWAKLPFDWEDDPRVMDYFDRHGEGDYKYLVRLRLALTEFAGHIAYHADNGHRLALIKRLSANGKRMTPKAAEAFLGRCAECGIIDATAWAELGSVNDREIYEGVEKRRAQTRKARETAAANAAAREALEAMGGNDGQEL